MAPSTGWADLLSATDPDDKVDGLRQIERLESVEGWTVTMVQLAGDRDDRVRLKSAEVLSKSVCPKVDEASGLAELLESASDGEVCYWAATMLGTLGPQASTVTAAIDALKNCLADSMYLPAREQSAWALRRIGPPAVSAVDALRAAAVDAPPRLRRLASDAIRTIGEAA